MLNFYILLQKIFVWSNFKWIYRLITAISFIGIAVCFYQYDIKAPYPGETLFWYVIVSILDLPLTILGICITKNKSKINFFDFIISPANTIFLWIVFSIIFDLHFFNLSVEGADNLKNSDLAILFGHSIAVGACAMFSSLFLELLETIHSFVYRTICTRTFSCIYWRDIKFLRNNLVTDSAITKVYKDCGLTEYYNKYFWICGSIRLLGVSRPEDALSYLGCYNISVDDFIVKNPQFKLFKYEPLKYSFIHENVYRTIVKKKEESQRISADRIREEKVKEKYILTHGYSESELEEARKFIEDYRKNRKI